MKTGTEMIADERQRQIDHEGWSAEHDDEHINGELVAAAVAYATVTDPDGAGENAIHCWPWEPEWFKPADNAIDNLIKAGALIAAEIDRQYRKAIN